MRKIFLYTLFLIGVVSLTSSCKDNFERIRKISDTPTKLKKAFEYYDKKDWEKAQFLFEDVMPLIKGDSIGERVYYNYGYCHYNQNNYTLAAYYFKQFFNTYPRSQFAEDALYMSASSNFKLSPNYRLDQNNTMEAIDGYQLFINTFPESPRVAQCNADIDEMRRKLEVKAFESAYLYYKLSDYKSAVYCFQSLLNDYPDSDNIEKIQFMIIKANYKLALNSVDNKREERLNETVQFYYNFLSSYPKSIHTKEAESIYSACLSKLEKIKSDKL